MVCVQDAARGGYIYRDGRILSGRQDALEHFGQPLLKLRNAVVCFFKESQFATVLPVHHSSPVEYLVALRGQKVIEARIGQAVEGHVGQPVDVFRQEVETFRRVPHSMFADLRGEVSGGIDYRIEKQGATAVLFSQTTGIVAAQ